MKTTFDVRIWETRTKQRARGVTYQVRWSTAKQPKSRTFSTKKLADSFRAKLLTAARGGEPFDIESGLPVSAVPAQAGPTWYEFAVTVMDQKWTNASPRHRKSTAEGLTTITTAMTTGGKSPDAKQLRLALMHWAFNPPTRRATPEPPAEYRDSLQWIEENTRPLTDLNDPLVLRSVLEHLARKLDGTAASPSTANRKRAALSMAIGYAVEAGLLEANPLQKVRIKRKGAHDQVDPRVVVNPEQARTLLAAVHQNTPELTAYFGCLYYAAMRPSEAHNLRTRDLNLPGGDGWGTAILSGSYQVAGKSWTDDGAVGEERELKHRPPTATRRVPLPPPLVHLLKEHLNEFAAGPDGRLFVTRVGPMGRPVARARRAAFTKEPAESPLARRPYDLRHAAVSTWLAAGVDATLVAEWAGHSVAVLLKVYAHTIEGRDQIARDRIEQALSDTTPPLTSPAGIHRWPPGTVRSLDPER